LLNQILSGHPQVSGLNEEGVMLTDKLTRPEDFEWRRMWWKCEDKMMPLLSSEAVAEKVKRHWSHFYDEQKLFLIEKSISNTPRALFFEEHFQPAYFIHIVRNGYAVAEGIRHKAGIMPGNPHHSMKEYPIEWCASQWKRSLELVDQYNPKMSHFLQITYEALTEDPDRTAKKICDFIGVSSFRHSLKDTTFEVHSLQEEIVNMNARSIKNLNQEQISAINAVAGDFLKRYGYFTTRT